MQPSDESRQNLIPVTTAACDGSEGQQWDIITSGKHNDQEGKINVVSSLVWNLVSDHLPDF